MHDTLEQKLPQFSSYFSELWFPAVFSASWRRCPVYWIKVPVQQVCVKAQVCKAGKVAGPDKTETLACVFFSGLSAMWSNSFLCMESFLYTLTTPKAAPWEEGSCLPTAQHQFMLPRNLPGLPPPAVVPHPTKRREPAVACLRGMVKIGTNAVCWELFQFLLIL